MIAVPVRKSFCLTPVSLLYIIFGIFFASVFSLNSDSAAGQLLASIAIQTAMLLMLLGGNRAVVLSRWKFLLAIFLIEVILVLLLRPRSHYTVLLYSEVMMFIVFFSVYSIPKKEFIAFLNKTYLIYLTVSVLVWMGIVPNIFYEPVLTDEFYVDLRFFGFYILNGFEGSPAFIDSYSALVLLMNFFLNHSRSRKLFMAVACFGILASYRLTPMVALLFTFISYPIYKNSRLVALGFMLLIFVIFLLLLKALLDVEYIMIDGQRVDIWVLTFAATHGRSMIWLQQLEVLFNNYNYYDYLFGRYSTDLFEVQAMQIWGQAKDAFVSNPHNTYLLLFFRSPLLFLLFFGVFLVAQFKQFNKTTFPVILFIYISAFANSSIISLGNPIYLMVIIYLLSCSKQGELVCGTDKYEK